MNRNGKAHKNPAGSEASGMHGNFLCGSREILPLAFESQGPHGEPYGDTTMMNGCRKSDSLIVSEKPANNICDNKHMAEQVEKRPLAKGNPIQQNKSRTQGRGILQRELDRIWQVACKSVKPSARYYLR